MEQGLAALRVVDLSTGIPGAYCARLLADAGADVVKVEAPAGDPLRAWSVAAVEIDPAEGSALFRFLHHGMRSVVGTLDDTEIARARRRCRRACSTAHRRRERDLDALRCRASRPRRVLDHAVRTHRALRGPPHDRVHRAGRVGWLDAARQARGGAVPGRRPRRASGSRGRSRASPPWRRRGAWQHTGHGEHIDVSVCEVMTIAANSYGEYMRSMMGSPPDHRTEPLDRDAFDRADARRLRRLLHQQSRAVRQLPRAHRAPRPHRRRRVRVRAGPDSGGGTSGTSRARVDTAPHDGRHREASERAAHPRRPRAQRRDDLRLRPLRGPRRVRRRPERHVPPSPPPVAHRRRGPARPRPAPRLGEHTGASSRGDRRGRPRPARAELPLAGVRVLDLTAWWAGPIAAGVLAALGADVIHVESISRIDGMRTTGAGTGMDGPWWERSTHYLCANTNKRNLTLDLSTDDGLGLLRRPHRGERRDPRELLARACSATSVSRGTASRAESPLPARADAGVRPVRAVARQRRLRADDGAGHGHGVDHRPPRRPAPHPAGTERPQRGDARRVRADRRPRERDAPAAARQLEVTMVEGALERGGRAGDRGDRLRQPARARRQPQPRSRAARSLPRGWRRAVARDRRSRPTRNGRAWWRRSARRTWAVDPELGSYAVAPGPSRRARRAPRGVGPRSGRRRRGRAPRCARRARVGCARPALACTNTRSTGRAASTRTSTTRSSACARHPPRRSASRRSRAGCAPRHRPSAPHNHDILVGDLGVSEARYVQLEADGVIGTHPKGA